MYCLLLLQKALRLRARTVYRTVTTFNLYAARALGLTPGIVSILVIFNLYNNMFTCYKIYYLSICV